ncbi:MAG: BamA/TamA family outer membrane protein, partial [Gemmatimonadota bacterium]
MGRVPSGATLVSACVLVLAGPLEAQEDGSPPRPEVTEIRFRGNQVFPDDSLRLAIANRETECRTFVFNYILPLCPLGVDFAIDQHSLLPDELRRDVVRLELYHWQRGYREAEVDTAVSRSASGREVRLTFQVDEGRPVLVDTIMFTGDPLPDPSLTSRLPLRRGEPLSQIQRYATRDTLLARLRNRGYAHADVLSNLFIPRDSYGAEVEFDVYTGPRARFGQIDVRWTNPGHSLSRESVLRFLPFGEGDVYSREEVLGAQRSLFGVELVQSANIREDTLAETPDSVVPMVVTISEGDVHRVGAGTGWSTADCFNAEARWTSRNFVGGARRLTVRGRVSNVLATSLNRAACVQAGEDEFAKLDWLASVELFQPWILSTRNSLSLSLFGERASLPDIFIRRAVGLNIALTRSLGRRLPATLAYRPELSELNAADIYFCTSFLVCDPDDIRALAGANWLAPLSVSVSLDRTDNLLNPSDGYHVSLDLEHASTWTASDYAYNRVVAEVAAYHALARRTVFAGRLRGGWVGAGDFQGGELELTGNVVHPQKRFYAGGASSVRGFAQNRLGPRVLTSDVENFLDYRAVGFDTIPPVCTPEAVADRTCDPGELADGAFFPRATGGS